MTAVDSGIIVIGVGNEYRGDDGAGIAAARRLRERFADRITVLEESGEGASLIESWKGAAWVILVDAVRSGAPPGTIHHFDAQLEQIPTGFFHYSTHAFSVAEAIELARSLKQLPPHMIVYGIEGESFVSSFGLSSAVESAVEVVVQRVADEVHTILK